MNIELESVIIGFVMKFSINQESEEIGDEVVAQMNPTTGTIENLAILFFSKRLQTTNIFQLPVIADLQLVSL
ncbi:MAG: hypothetical protein IM516_05825 [Pseudanabaena sp. M158S2SP1A06QC]|nr:hypothetical protein [Pseudanabaena sp. M53BS1SP1A06MG]MCA6596594.1 hypothetical protein [Pseudanabaena sp. M046S1SP1A06QC]MCA6611627.1 hypothetical protein [Pseudanabaena sp. M158S2SP1A06QC]MCA6621916.1 hypothetical protein [Pseudanabaena sp. M165S2SP1A06QC]